MWRIVGQSKLQSLGPLSMTWQCRPYGLFTCHMSTSYHSKHYSGYTLGTPYTHCTHAIRLKSIGEIETQCGSDMVSFSCN